MKKILYWKNLLNFTVIKDKMSNSSFQSNWTTVKNNKSSFPHHNTAGNANKRYNKNVSNKQNNNSPNYKEIILNIIKKNIIETVPNWTKIIENILMEFTNMKDDNIKKSLLMNTIVKFSLHEILENQDVIKILNSLHKVGLYAFIHIALWPSKDINKVLQRDEDDIFNTVRIIMEFSKFSILDQNDKKETVLKSLFEAKNSKYLGEEITSKIYNYLMQPNEKSVNKMTKEILNKITDSTLSNFIPTICWLISQSNCNLDKEIFGKLQFVKTLDRDATSGKYKEVEKISGFLNLIHKSGPGKSDFDKYFKENKWNSSKIVDLYNKISKLFIDSDLNQAYNTEIVGAIIGEFDNEQCIMNYCEKIIDQYPGTVMTCFAHAYPRFRNSKMLLILKSIYNTTSHKVKYNVELLIDNFEPGFIKNQSVKQTLPTDKKVFLKDKMNLNNINKLPKNENPHIVGQEIFPVELDDIAYSFEDYFKKFSKEEISEALIIKSIESINTEIGYKSIVILIDYLIIKGLDKKILVDTYNSSIDEIYELYSEENPIGSQKIKTILNDKFNKKSKQKFVKTF